MADHKANGLTQKELSLLILEGQDKINERIDQLHEKVNQKISRGLIWTFCVPFARKVN